MFLDSGYLLKLLQLALSGNLMSFPEDIEEFINESAESVGITLRFSIHSGLSSQLKFLIICYTLALRFDLSEINEDSKAEDMAEKLFFIACSDTCDNDYDFSNLLVGYQVETKGKEKALIITISSGDILWLHERIPFYRGDSWDNSMLSSDYSLRDKFIFDSLIINQRLPMKKNISFSSKKRQEILKKPRLSSSMVGEDSLSEKDIDDILLEDALKENHNEKDNVVKEELPLSLPKVTVKQFDWNDLLESLLGQKLEQFFDGIIIQNHIFSPFRQTFLHLLSDSSSFYCTEDEIANSTSPLKNIVSLNNIENILEELAFSQNRMDTQQFRQITIGFKALTGLKLDVKVSVSNIVNKFLNYRKQSNSKEIERIMDRLEGLISSKASKLERGVYVLVQMLIDPEIPEDVVIKKFDSFFNQYQSEQEEILRKLKQIFLIQLNYSPVPVQIEFSLENTDNNSIIFSKAGSSLKHLLLLIVTVHRRYGGCIILDQPEIFLSLQQQSQFRQYLSSYMKTNSLILITYSAEMLPGDCIYSCIRFNRNSNNTIQLSKYLSGKTNQLHCGDSFIMCSTIKELLFSKKILIVDNIASVRVLEALFSLLETDPEMIHILESSLNRSGLSLDISKLLSWKVIDSTSITDVHPSVITYGFNIPSLILSSIVTTASGNALTREIAQACPAFQYLRQVYGDNLVNDTLNSIFQAVEGVRGTLQRLNLQKHEELRAGEKTLLSGLEDELRPQLNLLEGQLQKNMQETLSKYNIHYWENTIGHMIAKTQTATETLFSAWLKHPLAESYDEDDAYAIYSQQWLRDLETNTIQANLTWRYLPLIAIKSAVRLLITEENEEFLHFCDVLGSDPNYIEMTPQLIKL